MVYAKSGPLRRLFGIFWKSSVQILLLKDLVIVYIEGFIINKWPTYFIQIDGYGNLKPFGIFIHGGTDGYSRKIYCLKLQIQITTIKWYCMDYIRGMQILPRVVRADENVITRKLQIFTEDAILMKCTRKKVSHWNVRFEPKNRNVVEFFMKTFPHFWRNLFKHLRDSVFINDSNVFTLYFVIYFILPSVLLPAINTTMTRFVYTRPCILIVAE